ncbi:DUF6456 domain-containing protein [Sandarakinorhabdus sp.]|uniref:DUF6456 domain-containing protein n=1 Tax=Sandarakinorhabdus sp. TaxID=1916663 RepID=UPI00286E35BA|nr:DUF6456 domain-containing protein [Sandarakinorhabdus sp.]
MGKATRERRVAVDRVEPTPEQLRHGSWDHLQVRDPYTGHPINLRRNLNTRNLERWFNRALIDDAQLTAGDRYRCDYERAGFNPRVTSCYEPVTAGGQAGHYRAPGGQNEAQMDAWDRYRDARGQIDPGLVWGFDSLILHDASFGDVPNAHDRLGAFTRDRWAFVVKLCLTRLVTHYRL